MTTVVILGFDAHLAGSVNEETVGDGPLQPQPGDNELRWQGDTAAVR